MQVRCIFRTVPMLHGAPSRMKMLPSPLVERVRGEVSPLLARSAARRGAGGEIVRYII